METCCTAQSHAEPLVLTLTCRGYSIPAKFASLSSASPACSRGLQSVQSEGSTLCGFCLSHHTVCRGTAQSHMVIITGALQQLAACNTQLRLFSPCPQPSSSSEPWRRVRMPARPWQERRTLQRVTNADSSLILEGHVAAFDSEHEPFELISINSVPVFDTEIHAFIERTHRAMLAGQRRRPTQQLRGPSPAFCLHLTMPEEQLTWTGTVLHASALFCFSSDVECLIATVLHTVWRSHMPATILARMESSLQSSAFFPAPEERQIVDQEHFDAQAGARQLDSRQRMGAAFDRVVRGGRSKRSLFLKASASLRKRGQVCFSLKWTAGVSGFSHSEFLCG